MTRRFQVSLTTIILSMAYVALCCAAATADDTIEHLIKEDRQQVEGVWRVVAIVQDGSRIEQEIANVDMLVSFQADGTWTLTINGEKVSSGTTVINPKRTPKTIDITCIQGYSYLGIYEFTDEAFQICFAAPDYPGPTEFAPKLGSHNTTMKLERKKSK